MLSHFALAQEKDVSFKGFATGEEGWDNIQVELNGVTNKTTNQLCLAASARSKDGMVRSNGTGSYFVPVGANQKIIVWVFRPYGEEAQKTDYLVLNVYECGRDTLLTQILDWTFVWPERHVSQNDRGVHRYGYLIDRTVKSWEAIFQTYEEEDFIALDHLMKLWSNAKEKDKDGEWKLDGFKEGYNHFLERKDWERNIQRIRKWKKTNPRSEAATLAEVHHWIAYAKHVRGNRSAANTDPIAMNLYHERMGRAEKLLQSSMQMAPRNPLWHEMALAIAIDMNKKPSSVEALFRDAIHSHPDYTPLYVTMANHWLSASWEGANWVKLDELAEIAAKKTSRTDGSSNYARIYMQVSAKLKPELSIFQNTLIIWPRMRKSFEDIVARYPSPQNLNVFASFACRAGDRESYLSIRPRIVHHIVPDAWPSNYSLDLCDRRFTQRS